MVLVVLLGSSGCITTSITDVRILASSIVEQPVALSVMLSGGDAFHEEWNATLRRGDNLILAVLQLAPGEYNMSASSGTLDAKAAFEFTGGQRGIHLLVEARRIDIALGSP